MPKPKTAKSKSQARNKSAGKELEKSRRKTLLKPSAQRDPATKPKKGKKAV
jgi:hypothetical protein